MGERALELHIRGQKKVMEAFFSRVGEFLMRGMYGKSAGRRGGC